jgi:hypothetical protein
MGPRLVFTVRLLAFGVALVFATLATLHQVTMRTSASLRSAARS